jgi:hypothetical protein
MMCMSVSVRLVALGVPLVSHMMVAYRCHLFLSILGAKILHESAARMVTVVSLVVSW